MKPSDGILGRVHSVQSLGTVDGPGVRCVIFLQGCPLRCVCCHNPDTWNYGGGTVYTVEELWEKVRRLRPYFGEKGGVTLSGGEPLVQVDFAYALFSRLKAEGIHTALDTSGCVWNEAAKRLLSVTDLVLLDHKYQTEEDYRRYTGGSLRQTETFLTELNTWGIETWLRRVIIPGLSDSEESVKRLCERAEQTACVTRVELLPFRKLCEEKYTAMGIAFPLTDTEEPDNATMSALREAGKRVFTRGDVL